MVDVRIALIYALKENFTADYVPSLRIIDFWITTVLGFVDVLDVDREQQTRNPALSCKHEQNQKKNSDIPSIRLYILLSIMLIILHKSHILFICFETIECLSCSGAKNSLQLLQLSRSVRVENLQEV